MTLFRRVFSLFALAVVGYLSALILMPPADAWMPRVIRAQNPESSALPCHGQQWPNADRVCLTWTAPREADAPGNGRRP
jgi:hypothetical protein